MRVFQKLDQCIEPVHVGGLLGPQFEQQHVFRLFGAAGLEHLDQFVAWHAVVGTGGVQLRQRFLAGIDL